MDNEFARLLQQVASGAIDDVHRVREIILNARTAIAAKEDVVREMRTLLLTAEDAFLTGLAPEAAERSF